MINKKTVGAILFDRENQLFGIARRSEAVDNPHVFSSVGGHVEGGEDLKEALKRELFEELGINIDNGQTHYIGSLYNSRKNSRYHTFLVIYDTAPKIKLNYENDVFYWFPFNKFPEPLHPSFKFFISKRKHVDLIKGLTKIDKPVNETTTNFNPGVNDKTVEKLRDIKANDLSMPEDTKDVNDDLNEYTYKSPVYSAVFLDKKSVKLLKEEFPPKHENEYYHHSTIKFRPSEDEINALAIGSKVKMRVVGYVEDDLGQAVIVDNPYSKNKYPHVTLTTSDDIKPNYSNELIEKGNVERVNGNIIIEGTIGVFEGGKVINEDIIRVPKDLKRVIGDLVDEYVSIEKGRADWQILSIELSEHYGIPIYIYPTDERTAVDGTYNTQDKIIRLRINPNYMVAYFIHNEGRMPTPSEFNDDVAEQLTKTIGHEKVHRGQFTRISDYDKIPKPKYAKYGDDGRNLSNELFAKDYFSDPYEIMAFAKTADYDIRHELGIDRKWLRNMSPEKYKKILEISPPFKLYKQFFTKDSKPYKRFLKYLYLYLTDSLTEDAEWNRFKKQGLGPQNSAYRTIVRVNPKCKKFPYCDQGDKNSGNFVFDDIDDVNDRNITWIAENLAKYLIKREK